MSSNVTKRAKTAARLVAPVSSQASGEAMDLGDDARQALEPDIDRWYSIPGRVEFLRAIERHWPDLLKSLKAEVVDKFSFADAQLLGADDRFEELLKNFDSMYTHGFDPWLLDVFAVSAMHWIRWPERQCRLVYFPEEQFIPKFVPELLDCKPNISSPPKPAWLISENRPSWLARIEAAEESHRWEDPVHFKKRIERQFGQQLNRYVNGYKNRLRKLSQHQKDCAEWVVLIMMGKQSGEIALQFGIISRLSLLVKKQKYSAISENPYQYVYKEAYRFANSIGIEAPIKKRLYQIPA